MPSSERSMENRRINKPVMEKKRRARINNCLNQLKALVLEGMKKDPARHSKLEKADILEMAVKHLKSLNSRSSGTSASRFQEGYADCARQVASYLNSRDGMDVDTKQRLMVHLASAYRTPNATIAPAAAPAAAVGVPPAQPQVLGSLQLVPTILTSGEVGYIIQPPQQRPLATATPRLDVTTPLSVSTASVQSQHAPPASVGTPSPAPSSPTSHGHHWEDELDARAARCSVSPSSSVASYGSYAHDYTRPESPQPLDLVAHNRGVDDNCWRPW